MILGICAFTPGGRVLQQTILDLFPEDVFDIRKREEALSDWARRCFTLHAPLLFIGACGIAVRTIAPYVSDKLSDPPVIVLDEAGEHVIPILSGHMGGGNELAKVLSNRLKQRAGYPAEAVITTATDVAHTFSVDVFAKKNGFTIVNRQGIQKISQKVLMNRPVTLGIANSISYDREQIPPLFTLVQSGTDPVDLWMKGYGDASRNALLTLEAKEYVLGIGCKKNTPQEKINELVTAHHVDLSRVFSVASIDLKAKEYGLLAFCQTNHLPLRTYSSAELKPADADFAQSEFVAHITGVGNVCESAAATEAKEGYQMLLPKTVGDGVTLAIAKRKVAITTWET